MSDIESLEVCWDLDSLADADDGFTDNDRDIWIEMIKLLGQLVLDGLLQNGNWMWMMQLKIQRVSPSHH